MNMPRIERITNPVALEPTAKSHASLKKRRQDEEQTSPLSRKRAREQETLAPTSNKRARVETQTSSASRKRKREEDVAELFPNKKRCMPLPEVATQNVNFDRNAWSSSKQVQPSEKPAVITLPAPQFERVEKDPLLHFPKVGGYYVAHIVGQAYELHLVIQEKQLEVFKVTHSGVQKLRDDQIELVREQIKNQQIKANWSYWSNALEYFGITANAAVGAGALFTGNVPVGAQMITGSAISLMGKLVRDFTDHTYKGAGLSVAGSLLSGYGAREGLGTIFGNDLPGKLAKTVTTFQKVSEVGVGYQQSKAQASYLDNRSKQVKNDFKRKIAEKEMEQIVGGLGKKDQANIIAAAAKTISVETQITGDIARGGRN